MAVVLFILGHVKENTPAKRVDFILKKLLTKINIFSKNKAQPF